MRLPFSPYLTIYCFKKERILTMKMIDRTQFCQKWHIENDGFQSTIGQPLKGIGGISIRLKKVSGQTITNICQYE